MVLRNWRNNQCQLNLGQKPIYNHSFICKLNLISDYSCVLDIRIIIFRVLVVDLFLFLQRIDTKIKSHRSYQKRLQ